MDKKTHKEIMNQIKKTETLTAVEIIRNHENPKECSVIINDKFFSMPYITEFNFELLTEIKNNVSDEILVILFNDDELPKAWRDSYLAEGIPVERHDRRVEFHRFDDMNEMFCIDRTLLWDITDYFKGTAHEWSRDDCIWRFEIIQWYKAHLI
jgi:hypothetical protein